MSRPENRQVKRNRISASISILIACVLAMSVTTIVPAQTKKPISKNGLLESIGLNALTTEELVVQIQKRGVNFQMSAADEQDFRAAGARPELIEAIRANYKSATGVPINNPGPVNTNTNNSIPNTSKPTANVPAGPPLAKNEVVTLLQGGLPSDRVQQFVEVRGVTFSMTPAISREIMAAGGNQSLIAAISSRGASNSNDTREIFKGGMLGVKVGEVTPEIQTQLGLSDLGGAYVETVEKGTSAERAGIRHGDVVVEFNGQVVNANTLPILVGKAPAHSPAELIVIRAKRRQLIKVTLGEQIEFVGPDYDELIDQAVGAIRANDANGAVNFLQQAIKANPDQPTAYNLLGFAQLYGLQDTASAETSMRAAIDHGGNASFRVYHDHNGAFTQICVGSLFISKNGITYKADDGVHVVDATRADINEAKANSVMGSAYGAFHIRATQDGKKNNYNFAPFTRKTAEATLILRLIQSYH